MKLNKKIIARSILVVLYLVLMNDDANMGISHNVSYQERSVLAQKLWRNVDFPAF